MLGGLFLYILQFIYVYVVKYLFLYIYASLYRKFYCLPNDEKLCEPDILLIKLPLRERGRQILRIW